MGLAGKGLEACSNALSADKCRPVHLAVTLGAGGDEVAMGDINDGHGDVVVVGQVADVLTVGEAAVNGEASGGVELVLGDALRVADKRGRVVLVADQLEKVLGTDTGLVRQREALRDQFDEAELKRVSSQPDVSCASGRIASYSLEAHSALRVGTEVHDLLADRRAEHVSRDLLGVVVAGHGHRDIGLGGLAGHTEDGSRKVRAESTLRAFPLNLSSGRGVNLRSATVWRSP